MPLPPPHDSRLRQRRHRRWCAVLCNFDRTDLTPPLFSDLSSARSFAACVCVFFRMGTTSFALFFGRPAAAVVLVARTHSCLSKSQVTERPRALLHERLRLVQQIVCVRTTPHNARRRRRRRRRRRCVAPPCTPRTRTRPGTLPGGADALKNQPTCDCVCEASTGKHTQLQAGWVQSRAAGRARDVPCFDRHDALVFALPPLRCMCCFVCWPLCSKGAQVHTVGRV